MGTLPETGQVYLAGVVSWGIGQSSSPPPALLLQSISRLWEARLLWSVHQGLSLQKLVPANHLQLMDRLFPLVFISLHIIDTINFLILRNCLLVTILAERDAISCKCRVLW